MRTLFLSIVVLQPVFNLQPSNPSSVVEGQNLSLQWSYNIGSKSIFGARFRNVTGSTPISVAIRRGNNNASVELGYENQFRATISDTEATLTILAVPRTLHEEKYELAIVFDDVTDLISGEVKILVLCKYIKWKVYLFLQFLIPILWVRYSYQRFFFIDIHSTNINNYSKLHRAEGKHPKERTILRTLSRPYFRIPGHFLAYHRITTLAVALYLAL